jgi:hypothetical protein
VTHSQVGDLGYEINRSDDPMIGRHAQRCAQQLWFGKAISKQSRLEFNPSGSLNHYVQRLQESRTLGLKAFPLRAKCPSVAGLM